MYAKRLTMCPGSWFNLELIDQGEDHDTDQDDTEHHNQGNIGRMEPIVIVLLKKKQPFM